MTGNSPAGIALLRYSPTEFTEFTEEVAESILPQISQIDTDRFFQGVHLSQVHQQSKKYTNRARSATTERVGALETSAPLESSICENLCNLWENILQEGSVYSVNSVGEYTARRFCENLCNLWENIQQEDSVYSVNSVGEHKEECNLWENIQQEGSVCSVNSVGEQT
ncbi:hypothetical protein HMPREF0673_01516 [Leyella stercorea DSM 18206]|uniref:Uncharacterized protein n=1 Tax=Leyella stercorea DSM 18206 TaxID=1002367 RepID=G6AY08_9BACT|nr:hypothetical protein HMPREF0673_01516 [Leyella stercorea DSM 18206]